SSGPYGVYHSTFDDYTWFAKFGDPTFVYEQEMARVLGLEVLHMASADVLPYDYELYGKEISAYLEQSQEKARLVLGAGAPDYTQAEAAAKRFTTAGARVLELQKNPPQ